MPKISVIVPVYQVEDKLNRCIDSILCQSFTDFELILVDDGSPDNSGKICDYYAEKDERVVVVHKENGGVSSARNKGLLLAKGEYISFVDSDDYVERDYLLSLYSYQQKLNADLVVCNFNLIEQNEISFMSHPFNDGFFLKGDLFKSVLYTKILNCDTVGFFSLWNKLFKINLIKENKIRCNESMSFGEDMLFIMDYIKFSESVIFITAALYNYERLENGLFSSYKPTFINDALKCYNRIVFDTQKYGSLLNLDFKYYYYIERYIRDVIKYEKYKRKKLKALYKNNTVIQIFSDVANIDRNEQNKRSLVDYELIIPRLVRDNKVDKAVNKTIYVYDEMCFLRRLKRFVVKIKVFSKKSKN